MIHAFLVMPCLNEAEVLRQTCLSLGFGKGTASDVTDTLVIVNNGSTDATLQVAMAIRQEAGSDRVVIVNCLSRGFVPARVAGVDKVLDICAEKGISHSQAIILQVDADARYSKNYALAFRRAAERYGQHRLYESRSIIPESLPSELCSFLKYLDSFDSDFFDAVARDAERFDCVVDDKTAGIILADWVRTGGLQRDYVLGKEMIYCGTSRLWLRLAAQGFRRHLVDDAACAHSPRKVLDGSDIYCALAGWPRGTQWKRAWRNRFPLPPSLTDFCSEAVAVVKSAALQTRRAHMEAMFQHAPKIFDSAIRGDGALNPAKIFYEAFALAGVPLDMDLVAPS